MIKLIVGMEDMLGGKRSSQAQSCDKCTLSKLCLYNCTVLLFLLLVLYNFNCYNVHAY